MGAALSGGELRGTVLQLGVHGVEAGVEDAPRDRPQRIAYPVRAAVRRRRNVSFRLARVTGVDLEARRLDTTAGDLDYDHLVVAAGAVNNYFGVDSAEEHAHGLKSLGEALAVRNHLLSCFERAAWTEDPVARRRLHTVVLVGGGATGVELAGAVSELVHLVLRKDFPDLDLGEVDIVIVEGGDTVLGAFAPSLQRSAIRSLERKGVRLAFGAQVAVVDENGVTLRDGGRIEAATVGWPSPTARDGWRWDRRSSSPAIPRCS
ncbi:MAG: hypothetical protein E6I76_10095 [Chloroflexi bacterium]|nr:MAG: hypothetical protein E6I76_10095 [Chloroflexota bacterium]